MRRQRLLRAVALGEIVRGIEQRVHRLLAFEIDDAERLALADDVRTTARAPDDMVIDGVACSGSRVVCISMCRPQTAKLGIGVLEGAHRLSRFAVRQNRRAAGGGERHTMARTGCASPACRGAERMRTIRQRDDQIHFRAQIDMVRAAAAPRQTSRPVSSVVTAAKNVMQGRRRADPARALPRRAGNCRACCDGRIVAVFARVDSGVLPPAMQSCRPKLSAVIDARRGPCPTAGACRATARRPLHLHRIRLALP